MTVLVTGAGGFIGRHVLRRLQQQGQKAVGMTRGEMPGDGWCQGDLDDSLALDRACQGASVVVHCAGYAHAFGALCQSDADMHWRVNYEGTRNLLTAAGEAGVRRFVFLSSVKAMGEPGAECLDEDWLGTTFTPYGQAKRAGEDAVRQAGQRFSMECVILRPSMVYGPGGKGNLERMAKAISFGRFPPLPETGNHRSLVHVDDVVSAISLAIDHPQSAGRTYIIAHPQAPSGAQLYDALRRALGMESSSWRAPESLLRLAGHVGSLAETVLHRRMPINAEVVGRLLDSAWYSPDRLMRELGWKPRVSLAEGLERLVAEASVRG